MQPHYLLIGLISLAIVSWAWDTVLELLNIRHTKRSIPDEIKGFYNEEAYLRSLDYHRDQTKFGFISGGFGTLLSIAMLSSGGFGFVDAWLRNYTTQPVWLALLFFGVLLIGADLISIPFQWYRTFVIEERYGFNKMTPTTFWTDKLKGYLIAIVLGGPLLAVLILFIQVLGPTFWIWFTVVAAAVLGLINLFYTSWFLPLFNKLTLLPDGDLKNAIFDFSGRAGFPVTKIFVMDGSKRSSKANAFFSGFGRQMKIVLFDTLIDKHTSDELVAVLAHEIGHYRKKHILISYVLSVSQLGLMMFVLSWFVNESNLSIALGGSVSGIHLNLLAFVMLYSPVSAVTGLLSMILSRKHEFEADRFAASFGLAAALSNALKKLSVDSLSNLYPHPLYVFFHYSHPPLLQRLAALHR